MQSCMLLLSICIKISLVYFVIQFMWILCWRFEVSQAFVMIALIMPRLALIRGIIPECYIGTVVTYFLRLLTKNALPCGRKDFNGGFR